MPKPPRPSAVLSRIVLSKISYYQPKSFHKIYQEVIDDYGTITERAIHRYIAALLKIDLIKLSHYDDEGFLYLRTGKWTDPPPKIDVTRFTPDRRRHNASKTDRAAASSSSSSRKS